MNRLVSKPRLLIQYTWLRRIITSGASDDNFNIKQTEKIEEREKDVNYTQLYLITLLHTPLVRSP